MTQTQKYTIERLIGATSSNVDRNRNLAVLAYAKSKGILAEARALILEARFGYIDWLTVTQRQWQARCSRRPQRNRHSDSWAIREKYVRVNKI